MARLADLTQSRAWLPSGLVVGLGLTGGLLQIYGGTWDIAWHVDRGRESFFSPPHLVLYAGILLVLISASIGLSAAATSGAGLLRRLRESPPLTAIVAATLLQLSSAPLDEFWHRSFGRDVSVWSPPHFVLIFGAAATFFALAALQIRRIGGREAARTAGWRDRAVLLLLIACGSGMLMGVVVESDFPGIPPWHPSQQRPDWVAPLIGTVATGFGLTIGARLGRPFVGSGTAVAAMLMLIRITSIAGLLILHLTPPYWPIWLVAGGPVLDALLPRVPGAGPRTARDWLLLALIGAAFALVLWGVSAGWLAATGLAGPRPATILGVWWLLLPAGSVGVVAGDRAAAFIAWLGRPVASTEPSPRPAVLGRAASEA